MKTFKLTALTALAAILLVAGCKKDQEDYFITPPSEAHFLNQSSGTLFLTSTNASTRIRVGATTVADRDRTVNISVTSRTGAVEGTHYNLPSKTISIKAGQVIDSFTVSGVLSQYLAGRRDTLIIRLTGGDGLAASGYNDSFRLALRGPCFTSDINTDLQSLVGTYRGTTETLGTGAPYGPYTTTIKSATRVSATSANIVVGNLYDDSPTWNDLTFTLDWSDLNNTKITLVQQVAGGNAGNTFGATYAGQAHAVRPVPAASGGQVGTFDFCNQRLTLRMQIGINNVGFSASLYTVNLAR